MKAAWKEWIGEQRAALRLLLQRYHLYSIHSMILVSFTLLSVLLTLFLSGALYKQFSGRLERSSIESTEQLLRQTAVNLEDYLLSMRRISDAMYYDVIKDKDLATDTVDNEMNLIYEAHRDNLVSVALYSGEGELISASPVGTEKKGRNIPEQGWFRAAVSKVENLHFSTPHVQNLFDDNSFRYRWVISLSRVVELTKTGSPESGVLLVDMNYSTIEHMLSRLNEYSSGQYFYLCDGNGRLIYHPRQMQISNGLYVENNGAVPGYEDGAHEEEFRGSKRFVVVDTVGYTGWKLVSVIPVSRYFFDAGNMRYFVIMLSAITLLIMLLMNQLISLRISYPLMRLNDSIREMEKGAFRSEVIYVGGTTEVEHLGKTLRRSIDQINMLMDDIVVEQEEKRKSEMDALQSQINPHFLYNTLDSIVWMIEGGHNKDAAFMVTQLASFFRISLSRGKNIISIEQELRHAENYMNIQKVRYKNSFSVRFEIDPEIKEYLTVKLIVQPVLENAIYYGVEGMDGEGEIVIRGGFEERADGDRDICLSVEDNGFGMPEEAVRGLLREDTAGKRVPRHGSGVGLINVHKRIQLRFGLQYGLLIRSEPDEGTCVSLRFPAVLFNEENQERLEAGRLENLSIGPEKTEEEDGASGQRTRATGRTAEAGRAAESGGTAEAGRAAESGRIAGAGKPAAMRQASEAVKESGREEGRR